MTKVSEKTNPTSARVTGLISGLYLLLVVVLATVFLSARLAPDRAQAQDTNLNSEVTFNINQVPLAPSISFTAPADDATIKDDQVVLAWESTNADFESGQITDGDTDDWNPSAASLEPNGGYTVSNLAAGEYTFEIIARDVEGEQKASDSITVTVSPESLYELNDPTTEIDGEPGSTSTVQIQIASSNNFSGDVDLSNINIPTRGDGEGNQSDLFRVTLDDTNLSGPSDTATAEIETLLPIYEDTPQTIQIQGDSGGQADEEDSAVITINPDPFSPRTIEEF